MLTSELVGSGVELFDPSTGDGVSLAGDDISFGDLLIFPLLFVSSDAMERSDASVLLMASRESGTGVSGPSWLTLLLSDVESEEREVV